MQLQGPKADTAGMRAEGEVSPGYKPAVTLLVIAAFVVILNETLLGVALPDIVADLGVTTGTAQWLTSGYLLTMAAMIPATGFLIERFHVRTLFLASMLLFLGGTVVAACSPDFAVLLMGRIIQASGTAVMMPLLSTTVLNVVPISHRGKMMGLAGIVISVAPAAGPTVSGFILSVLDWRWLFWTMAPIAGATIVLAMIFLRNVTSVRKVPVDVLSIVLSAAAFGGIVYGLNGFGEASHSSLPVPPSLFLAVGGTALAIFVARQLHLQNKDRPFLDLRTFKSRIFTVASSYLFLVMAILFGTLILLPLYMQNALGMGPLTAGLVLLPGGLLMGVLAPTAGALFDRFGARKLVIPGAAIVAGALWWMTTLGPNSPPWLILCTHATLSLGISFIFTPLSTSALGSLPVRLYSHGSAIMGTVQQLGGAIGTAVFVTVMSISASSTGHGAPTGSAMAQGFHVAVFIGAIIATAGVLVAAMLPAAAATERRA